MKICSPQLGLNPNSDLGGEVHDHFVIKHLAQRGHILFVYLPKGRPYHKHKNIIIERAAFKHIPALFFNILIIPYLFKTYKKEKFDVLRVHNPYFVGLGALFFKAFHPDVPIVTTHHLVENGMVFNLINRLTLSRYDAIITVSNYIKNWLIERYRVPRNKIIVIYNGVDKQLSPEPKDISLLKKYNLQGKIVLMYMGFLIERKNPLFLLKVYRNLKKKHKGVALLICGEGPLRNEMENFVEQNNLKDVVFAGRVFGQDKQKHFNLCDIFIMPSKNEGFGLVIGEAMACAKPVVITSAWSASEAITNGEEGFLAEAENEQDWYHKIEKLIQDKKRRQQMGQNGIKKTQAVFSWHKVVPQHERLFFRLTKK